MRTSTSWTRAIVASTLLLLAPLVLAQDDAEAPKVNVKEIKMYSDNWSWSPSTIRVDQGTLLKVTVDNVDATHRFDLKAYGLKVMLPQDKTTSFEFIVDQAGEFRWKCGRPCGNGCAKMRGKLIVAEAKGAAGS